MENKKRRTAVPVTQQRIDDVKKLVDLGIQKKDIMKYTSIGSSTYYYMKESGYDFEKYRQMIFIKNNKPSVQESSAEGTFPEELLTLILEEMKKQTTELERLNGVWRMSNE